jgi:hypothetical protein
MNTNLSLFKRFQDWFRRLRFQEGRTLSRFIACDVRRDILIKSTKRIDEGIIITQVRTINVLHVARGLVPEPEFEPPREVRIREKWKWSGQTWGGLPDGTSIFDHLPGDDQSS